MHISMLQFGSSKCRSVTSGVTVDPPVTTALWLALYNIYRLVVDAVGGVVEP